MASSKAQILQALQAKIDKQEIAPTNPVDSDQSAPKVNKKTMTMICGHSTTIRIPILKLAIQRIIRPILGGNDSFLSMELIASASPTGLCINSQKIRYLPHPNEEVVLLDQNYQEAILRRWNEIRRQDEDAMQHTHQEHQIPDPDTPRKHNSHTVCLWCQHWGHGKSDNSISSVASENSPRETIHPLGQRRPSYGDYSVDQHLVDDYHDIPNSIKSTHFR
eukprot:jgi/Psemu1/5512/gm1.5512_g